MRVRAKEPWLLADTISALISHTGPSGSLCLHTNDKSLSSNCEFDDNSFDNIIILCCY